ncbi:MAG: SMP-30/gluconolactonase/LRE family protein [bacterium]
MRFTLPRTARAHLAVPAITSPLTIGNSIMPPRARLAPLAALTLALAACHAGAPITITNAPVRSATVGANAMAPSRIDRLDPAFDAIVPPGATIEKLADGFDWTEGPVWRRDRGYLLFSDIPKNTVYKWKDGEGISVFMRPAGYTGSTPQGLELGTNGLTLDAQGRIVFADHGNRLIARLNDTNFTRTVLADRYEGKRFNSPNDLIYRANGDLYFTDPPYGLFKRNDDPNKELSFNGIYRLTPSGTLTMLARDLSFPNGIAISPDGNTLYVALSDGKNPYIYAYDIQGDGTVANRRVFFDAGPLVAKKLAGALDGMKVDAKGNVFATAPGGVVVLSPQGKHLGTIYAGDVTANVAFGDDGSTLYMTSNHALMRVRTTTKGQGF